MNAQLSQEDMGFLRNIVNQIQQTVITGTEVGMSALGKYASSLAPSDIAHLSKMFKTYGYFGVFFAIKDFCETGETESIQKYVLGTFGYWAVITSGAVTAHVVSAAILIGIMVDISWKIGEWIAENQDDILEKIKQLLSEEGVEISEERFQCELPAYINVCPILKEKTICEIKGLFKTAEETRSPLVLDLDGDGIETITADSGVYFDHDGNLFQEKTAWVAKDDALLVRDINGNGKIDNGTELFGNNSVLSSGEKAVNGFEALKDLDSNKDGIFNANDEAWNEVKVWKDNNQNGITEPDELLSLEQVGIVGINLDYNNQETVDENGNAHKQAGTFIKADGTTGTVSDVWFDTNPEDTLPPDLRITHPVEDDVRLHISASGNVFDLLTAMALDESGALRNVVEAFWAEDDIATRNALLPEIIYRWAGVYDMDPDGRNPTRIYGNVLGDCRKLEALEEFLGREFLGTWCSGERDPNPHGHAAPYILQAFDLLEEYTKNMLLLSGNYKSYAEGIKLVYNLSSKEWTVDASEAVSLLSALYTQNASYCCQVVSEFSNALRNIDNYDLIVTAFKNTAEANYDNGFAEDLGKYFGYNVDGSSGNDAIFGTAADENIYGRDGDDKIYADDGNDLINGGNGDDHIYGENGNDILIGDAGNDYLLGGDGNDVLTGGSGNDYLSGGNGADIYKFGKGFGQDTIDNINSDQRGIVQDVIQFDESISPDNITLNRQGFDLIITVNYDDGSESDSIRILSYFDRQGSTSTVVDLIEFADGTQWNYDYVLQHWSSLPAAGDGEIKDGDENNNSLSGSNGDDVLLGYGGNDDIWGGSGNDWIEGGTGNDTLQGQSGNDTYFWGIGDGLDAINDGENNDTMLFGEGVYANEIKFRCINTYDLQIMVAGSETQGIIIRDFFYGIDRTYKTLKFADGSIIRLSDHDFLLHQTDQSERITAGGYDDIIYAEGGDDYIDAGHGNDILIGGTGNDELRGNEGDDTYVWNRGDGLDTIWETAGNDTIRFGENITFDDLKLVCYGGDLLICLRENEAQGVMIMSFFSSQKNKYMVEKLQFADGYIFNLSDNGLVLEQKNSIETIKGTDFDDTIYGNGGADTIYAKGGNDTIVGGKGIDIIYGDDDYSGTAGNDTYIWNLGDGFDELHDSRGNNTIRFGEGIALSNLIFRHNGNHLDIYVNGDRTQGVKLINYYYRSQGIYYTLEFVDGTTLNLAESGLILTQSDKSESCSGTAYNDVIYGNGGDDTLRGKDGNDILVGGKGNDELYGDKGNDTIIWNLGDGLDTVIDYNTGINTIQFGEGITFERLTFERDNRNLYIYVDGDRTQGVKLTDFASKYLIKFADGTTYSPDNDGFMLNQSDKNDNASGDEYEDIMYGNGGNDTLYGKGGNDTLVGGKGNDNLQGGDGRDIYLWNLGDGFDEITDFGENIIRFGEGITFADLSWQKDGENLLLFVNGNTSQGMNIKNYFYGSGHNYTLEFSDGGSQTLNRDNLVFGTEGIPQNLVGTDENDILNGGSGHDNLTGENGDDIISGGRGNDILDGGAGNDTFIWNLGDGFDVIKQGNGTDTLSFGTGITFNDIHFYRDYNDLYIYVGDEKTEGLKIENFFYHYERDMQTVRFLKFSDDSVQDICTNGFVLEQFSVGNGIDGTNYNDIIYGNIGNDQISAGSGDDVLIGGKGNDILVGEDGSDTYIWRRGDGLDIIREYDNADNKIIFGDNVSFSDLSFMNENDNLNIFLNDDHSQGLIIEGFFSNNQSRNITLQFSNGTSFNLAENGLVLNQTNGDENIKATDFNDIIFGEDGNDEIYANGGNDIIIGGCGNDMLNGGAGDDIYQYNLGDGFDIITESGGNDKIVFGDGISQNDLSFEQIGNNLRVIVNGDENKGLQINNQFGSSSAKVETIELYDGSMLDISNADQLIQAMNSFNNSNSASIDTQLNMNQDVNDTYSLAAGQELFKKVI